MRPVTTLPFCPKSLARRFGRVYLERFTELFKAIDSKASEEELELKARLLLLTPLAVLAHPGRAEELTERDLTDRKSTRLNSSHSQQSRMPSSA